mgnify:CR=1 FL=1
MDIVNTEDLLKTSSFHAYVDYVGLKNHFKQPNYIWNSSVAKKMKIETFLKRKDSKMFSYVASKYKRQDDWRQMMISCFIMNQDCYVRDIVHQPEPNTPLSLIHI